MTREPIPVVLKNLRNGEWKTLRDIVGSTKLAKQEASRALGELHGLGLVRFVRNRNTRMFRLTLSGATRVGNAVLVRRLQGDNAAAALAEAMRNWPIGGSVESD